MKNLVTVLVLAVMLAGCKKYEEGPLLSLRSKNARVANTWKVEQYLLNGVDKTNEWAGYTETYTKEGAFSFSSGSIAGAGVWEWQNDKNEIKRSGISKMSSQTLYILRLKENKFWYLVRDGSDIEEFHMESVD